MRFLFDDGVADYETLRAAGYVATGGADLGEILTTAAKIEDSSPEAWWTHLNVLAERVRFQGEHAAAEGRCETAAGSWL